MAFLLLLNLFPRLAPAQTWISGVSVGATDKTATIIWTTAVPADTQVRYGLSTNYGTRSPLDPTLALVHSVTLTKLRPGNLYHFRCMSNDAAAELVLSMDYTFQTTSGPVAVTISPTSATVNSGGTQQFTAQVTNSSNTTVSWSATDGTVDVGGLFTAPKVTQDETVYVTATSVADPTKSARATVTVKAPAPVLSLSPTSLAFTAVQGGSNPAPANVSVTNTGGGTLSFTVTSDAAWLVVSPTGGTAPATLQVAPVIAGMSAGVYTGHVTISAPGAQNSPGVVTVTLTMTAPPVQHSVDLNWNASSDNQVVGYNAYRSTTSGGPYGLLASAIGGLTYTDGTVQPGVTYYYVVTATDNQGNESVDSNEAQAVIPSP